jgi:hypothetical protein
VTRPWANLIAFQTGWLACVLSAAHGLPSVGFAVAVGAVALHLWLAARPAAELRLIALAVGIGAIADSLLLAVGWVRYPSGMLIPLVAPYWILAMWALFATTLNVCLAWLKHSLPLAALLGAAGGPLSYVAGARLGGISLVEPEAALPLLAAVWAAAMTLLVIGARHFNGIGPSAAKSLPPMLHQGQPR